jgi:anti-anti-sigma factor
MHIKEEKREGYLIIKPEGRLDTMNHRALEELLADVFERGEKAILLNCASMDYISSSGLRVLLMALKRSKAMEGKMALCCVQDSIREVLDISGFSSIFEIYDTLEEAEKGVTSDK